jgi:RecB family endonuclease NucS
MDSQVIEQGFQRVWQMFQETDRKFEKYFGKIKEMDRNWGKLVESLVKPSVAAQFRKRGIPIIGSGQRVEREIGGETIEIDILLTDGDSVVAVEVKTKLTVEHVNEHIEKHLKPFRRFFPEYRDKKVYGAVAYIHLEENADRYAYKNGLFVLTFDVKNMVRIKNDSKFIPKPYETESC